MWTKQQLIEKAYELMGLAAYTYDLSPEIRESALQDLDSMMADWFARGIAIGYLLPSSPDDSNIDDDSGIPDTANAAVYCNLAVLRAPAHGKTLQPDVKLRAKQGFDRLLGAAARAAARPVPMPSTMPIGAGNRCGRAGGRIFFPGDADALNTATGDVITTS